MQTPQLTPAQTPNVIANTGKERPPVGAAVATAKIAVAPPHTAMEAKHPVPQSEGTSKRMPFASTTVREVPRTHFLKQRPQLWAF